MSGHGFHFRKPSTACQITDFNLSGYRGALRSDVTECLLLTLSGHCRAHLERHATRAPAARGRFKDAMTGSAASDTATVRRQMPPRDVIPITADHQCPAAVTQSGLPARIVNITRIDVAKTDFARDLPRHPQSFRWGRRTIHHLPIRMKRREVQRHVWTKMTDQPIALCFDFRS